MYMNRSCVHVSEYWGPLGDGQDQDGITNIQGLVYIKMRAPYEKNY